MPFRLLSLATRIAEERLPRALCGEQRRRNIDKSGIVTCMLRRGHLQSLSSKDRTFIAAIREEADRHLREPLLKEYVIRQFSKSTARLNAAADRSLQVPSKNTLTKRTHV